MAMMVYSKGGDTTNCHIRYWKLCLFWGMCLVSGLALMAKSMQALCGRCQRMRGANSREASCSQPPGAAAQIPCAGPSWDHCSPRGPLIKPDSLVDTNLGSHHTLPCFSPGISLASSYLQYQLADVRNQFREAGLQPSLRKADCKIQHPLFMADSSFMFSRLPSLLSPILPTSHPRILCSPGWFQAAYVIKMNSYGAWDRSPGLSGLQARSLLLNLFLAAVCPLRQDLTL